MTLPKLHVALPEPLARFRAAPRPGLRFDIAELDALLPGGVPRGQFTALDAPLGSGGTALLLALAEATLRTDEGVAVVDAMRMLAPQAAAHLAQLGSFWVIRPRGTEGAWWCADVLLRTGAFGLVVVDQADEPPRKIAVRLQRLARDRDAALVVRGRTKARGHGGMEARTVEGQPQRSTPGASIASVRLCVHASETGFTIGSPGGFAWPGPRTVRVTITKGGAPRAAEIPLALTLPHRLRPHWAVRDRRPGAGQRSQSGRSQRQRVAEPDWPI